MRRGLTVRCSLLALFIVHCSFVLFAGCYVQKVADGDPFESPKSFREWVGARNDLWDTLRSRVTLAIEMQDGARTERAYIHAKLLARRPNRLRLTAEKAGETYFDVVWTGKHSLLIKPLPGSERTTRLREVLGAMTEDLRRALRLNTPKNRRLILKETQVLQPRLMVLKELLEKTDGVLETRSVYEPHTLHRKIIEIGKNEDIELSVHYNDHRKLGRTMFAHQMVVVNEKLGYWVTVDFRDAALDVDVNEEHFRP